jgi:sulfate permease, SulP family
MKHRKPFARIMPYAGGWAADYLRTALRPDLFAGLTVAMIAVPQSMAYAQLAGLPPIFGLYSVILPAVVGALFGSSSHLVTGSSNATALATVGVLAVFLAAPNYPEYAFLMAILTGIIRLVMGLMRLGFVMRYVSNSVLTGLLTAIGTLIIINQLPALLGVPRPPTSETLVILQSMVTGLGQINPFVLATGIFSMALMIGVRELGRKIRRVLPGPLFVIILAAGLVALAGWHERGVPIVSDISPLESAGVRFHLPAVPLADIPLLLPGALALAFFSLMEAINIAKAVGMNAGERIDASREFIGQGVASLVGGFFQSFPTTGSPARTTVNYTSGARTRLAAAYSGLFAWLVLLLFTGWIGYIPNASLAGVLIVSAAGVFNVQHIRLTWQSSPTSRAVMLVTYLSALLLPLHYAIYAGVALSVLIYLYESSRLRMSYLTLDAQGYFVEHPMESIARIHPKIVLINVEGPLYFGATEDLERQLIRIFHSGVKVVILRVRRVHMLGSTGITVLENVLLQANTLGIMVLFSGVTGEVEGILRNSGLANLIGPEQTFLASRTLFSATREAIKAAQIYIGEDADVPIPDFTGK